MAPCGGEVLINKTDDRRVKIDVRLENETLWMTQQMMAELFQTTVPNISMHIRNIYEEDELFPSATVKKFLTVRRPKGEKNRPRRISKRDKARAAVQEDPPEPEALAGEILGNGLSIRRIKTCNQTHLGLRIWP